MRALQELAWKQGQLCRDLPLLPRENKETFDEIPCDLRTIFYNYENRAAATVTQMHPFLKREPMMNMLHVQGDRIVDQNNLPIQLRGTCVGGWMNMENFINGYPGSEYGLRARMAEALGKDRAQFFFDRLLDYFFNEDDIAFIRSTGATVVRLPLNYRHFERDEEPFQYLETGFQRLDQAIGWCEKHNLYVILDLHAVQGWQNPDWHSDNSSRHSLFWQQRQFQDRFVALWEELARRYTGNAAVAGYNVMNEPVTGAFDGHYAYGYQPGWEIINTIYRRVVEAIRKIDSEHIIFLEGDRYSSMFDGLDAPFDANLVYSSHNYSVPGFGPGSYPGLVHGAHWDYHKQLETFQLHSGTRFAQKYQVPLWVGEFGSAYNGPQDENPDRIRALDDQISIFERFNAHWTTWTYKDIDVMGWVQLDPQCEYVDRLRAALRAKKELSTDFWMRWLPATATKKKVYELAQDIEEVIGDRAIDEDANQNYLVQATLSCYTATLLQPQYVRVFKGLSESELDRVLQSFALKNCRQNRALIETVTRHQRS